MAKPGQKPTSGRVMLWCMVLVLIVWPIFQLGSILHLPIHEIESIESALDLPLRSDVVIEKPNVPDEGATTWLSSLLIERNIDGNDAVPWWLDLSHEELFDHPDTVIGEENSLKMGCV